MVGHMMICQITPNKGGNTPSFTIQLQMKQNKTWYVNIPANLNAASIIPETTRTDAARAMMDGIHYMVSLLLPQPHEHKKQDQWQNTGYITLNSAILKQVIGNRYTTVRQLLEQHGIIKVNKHFLTGSHSMKYRLSAQYLTTTISVEIKDRNMKKRYFTEEGKQKRIQGTKQVNTKHLKHWLDSSALQLDLDAMHNFVEWYGKLLRDACSQHQFTIPEQRREAEVRIAQRVDAQKEQVRQLREQHKRTTVDASGRFYSPVVSIKSEHRSFLTVNGKPLWTADIKASQPYLFSVLMGVDFWKNTKKSQLTLYKVNRRLYNRLRVSGTVQEVITLLTSYRNEAGQGFELSAFGNHDWRQDFYASLQQVMASSGKKLRSFKTRDKAKRATMQLLFGSFTEEYQPTSYLLFRKHYPKEVAVMDVIKKASRKKRKKYAGSDVLALLLQSIEAEIVIKRVTKRIHALHPHIPLYTIHDGIASTEEHIRFIGEELSKELLLVTGKEAGIKYEPLQKEATLNNLQQTVDNDWQEILDEVKQHKSKHWVNAYQAQRQPPVLYKIPAWNGSQIICTIYSDPLFDFWEGMISFEEECENQ